MKRNRFSTLKTSIALLFITLLCSCGSKSVNELIPADVTFVCKVDLKSLLENGGCSIGDKGLTLPKEVESFRPMIGEGLAVFDRIFETGAGVDFSQIYIYLRNKNDVVMFAPVEDEDKLCDNLEKEFGKPSKKKGYKVYEGKSAPVFAVKDDYIFLAQNVDVLIDADKAADDKNINEVPGMEEYLSRTDQVLFAISTDFIAKEARTSLPTEIKSGWLTASLNVGRTNLTLSLSTISSDGGSYNFGSQFLNDINTDVLAYLPQYSSNNLYFAAAIGEIVNPQIISLIKNAVREGRDRTVADLYNNFKGSAALGLSVNDFANKDIETMFRNVRNSDWGLQMGLVGQFNKNFNIVPLLDQRKNELFSEKISRYNSTPSLIMIRPEESSESFYIGNPAPGINYIGNYEARENYSNQVADKFRGKKMATFLHIPVNDDMRRLGLDYALNSEFALTSNSVKFTISFEGSPYPFMRTVLNVILGCYANRYQIEDWLDELDKIKNNNIRFYTEEAVNNYEYNYNYDYSNDYNYNYDYNNDYYYNYDY